MRSLSNAHSVGSIQYAKIDKVLTLRTNGKEMKMKKSAIKSAILALLMFSGVCACAADNSVKVNEPPIPKEKLADNANLPGEAPVCIAPCGRQISCPMDRQFRHHRRPFHRMANRPCPDGPYANCPVNPRGLCVNAPSCPAAKLDRKAPPPPQPGNRFGPACDIRETKGAYELILLVPGMSKDDLKIDLDGKALIVSGEKKINKEERSDAFYASERFYGSFRRYFELPNKIKAEDVKAECKDGILKIKIKKPNVKKHEPKTIKID